MYPSLWPAERPHDLAEEACEALSDSLVSPCVAFWRQREFVNPRVDCVVQLFGRSGWVIALLCPKAYEFAKHKTLRPAFSIKASNLRGKKHPFFFHQVALLVSKRPV
jgi:hypothetical protein